MEVVRVFLTVWVNVRDFRRGGLLDWTWLVRSSSEDELAVELAPSSK